MKKQIDENTKKVVKVIFAWQDEKEEKWLEEEAANGWHLETAAPYVYWFHRGEPAKVAYRLDYKNTLDKDYAEYTGLFKDSGWELVASFANWHYYRIDKTNQSVPEIYNSGKSKAQKYHRVLLSFLPMLPIYFILFNPAISLNEERMNSPFGIVVLIIKILMLALLLFYGYVLIRLLSKIKQLESESRE